MRKAKVRWFYLLRTYSSFNGSTYVTLTDTSTLCHHFLNTFRESYWLGHISVTKEQRDRIVETVKLARNLPVKTAADMLYELEVLHNQAYTRRAGPEFVQRTTRFTLNKTGILRKVWTGKDMVSPPMKKDFMPNTEAGHEEVISRAFPSRITYDVPNNQTYTINSSRRIEWAPVPQQAIVNTQEPVFTDSIGNRIVFRGGTWVSEEVVDTGN